MMEPSEALIDDPTADQPEQWLRMATWLRRAAWTAIIFSALLLFVRLGFSISQMRPFTSIANAISGILVMAANVIDSVIILGFMVLVLWSFSSIFYLLGDIKKIAEAKSEQH